jgi:predicted DNA-binding protein YlxM (UPF0122 family)
MSSTKIHSSEYSELVRLYHEEGLSQAEIAIKYKVTSAAICRIFKKIGVDIRNKKLSSESKLQLIPRIVELSQEGKTRREIAIELNLSYQVVYSICNNFHIPVKRANDRNLVDHTFGYWKVLSRLGYKTSDGGYSLKKPKSTKDNTCYCECICLHCNKTKKPVSESNLVANKSKCCLSCSAKLRYQKQNN